MRDLTAHVRAEAAAGRLTYQSCPACGAVQSIPRPFCARCGADAPEWRVSEGRGRVVAVTTLHRAPTPDYRERVPYAIALVDLAEGVRVMGHAEPGFAPGGAVQAEFHEVAERSLLLFRRDAGAG